LGLQTQLYKIVTIATQNKKKINEQNHNKMSNYNRNDK